MAGRPHTWWLGQPAGQLWWGARLDGAQGARPPCMGSVPYNAFGLSTMYLNQSYQLSGITLNQALRKEMKTTEQTDAGAVRKVSTDNQLLIHGNNVRRERVMRKVVVS